MQSPISDFLKIIVPIIIILIFSIPFLLLAISLPSIFKNFFQKKGIVLDGSIFNGVEECAVVVINDNINSMKNVVSTLRTIGISEKMAIDFMLRIHKEGIAIVWTGTRNEALQYVQIIRQNGLRCFMTAIQE
jgi:ATP-dependent Clp protease adapter protein ClpS